MNTICHQNLTENLLYKKSITLSKKSRRMKCMVVIANILVILVGREFGRSKFTWEDNIKTYLKETGCGPHSTGSRQISDWILRTS
jgi:hypothetical protein